MTSTPVTSDFLASQTTLSPEWPPSPNGETPYDTPINSNRNTKIYSDPSTEKIQTCVSLNSLPADTGKKNWDSQIEEIARKDDLAHMPKWKRILYLLSPIFVAGRLITFWIYLVLRITFAVESQKQSASQSYVMAYLFTCLEAFINLPNFLQTFWQLFAWKARVRPQLRLKGDDVPMVDVFVTCCREDAVVIMDTVRAACAVDYPSNRFRVIVLDDGGDRELRGMVTQLSDTFPNAYYRSRTKIPGVPHHFKAGNLNYGLEETDAFPGGAAPFTAALDADMIPEPDWLRALMPHLLRDENMAMACPPQLFYNVPKGDPLAQSLDFFVHVSEPIKDALGCAWCTGSGYIFRRAALEDIGRFPLGSLAEDVATSTLMLGRGWQTAFVHEPLQFGTIPEDFEGHLKQRTRWAIGTIDTTYKLNFFLYGDAIKKMSWIQRMCGFMYGVFTFYNIPFMLSLFFLPIVLYSGRPIIGFVDQEQMRWLTLACLGSFIVGRVTEVILYLPSGYADGQRGGRGQMWMSPYLSLSLIRSFFLPKWLGGQLQTFKPTGSIKSAINERDPVIRAGLFARLRVLLFGYSAIFHLAYVWFGISSVTLSSSRCVAENSTIRDQLLCLVTHAFWPPLAWVLIILSTFVPIMYMIQPPDMPPREELLKTDPKTGVRRPTEGAKKIGWAPSDSFFEIEYFLTTGFTIFIFVITFYL